MAKHKDGAIDDPAGCPERCVCKGAVLRAYSEMLSGEVPHNVAMEAAVRVYRYHHPEDAPDAAGLIVERWIHAGRMH